MRIWTLALHPGGICFAGEEREAPPPARSAEAVCAAGGQHLRTKNGMKVTLAAVRLRADGGDERPNGVRQRQRERGSGVAFESPVRVDERRHCHLTAEQVANEAARMGGQLDVSAGTDESSARIEVLSEFAADAVKLVADVLRASQAARERTGARARQSPAATRRPTFHAGEPRPAGRSRPPCTPTIRTEDCFHRKAS